MFGKNLLARRKSKGWTQEEVANRIIVTKQTYSHYENENRIPSLDKMLKLAEVFDTNIHALFGSDSSYEEAQTTYPVKHKIETLVEVFLDDSRNLNFKFQSKNKPIVENLLLKEEKYIYFDATDNSMKNLRIMKADKLLIRMRKKIKNGDIALIYVNEKLLVRKIMMAQDLLILEPANPNNSIEIFRVSTDQLRFVGTVEKVIITI